MWALVSLAGLSGVVNAQAGSPFCPPGGWPETGEWYHPLFDGIEATVDASDPGYPSGDVAGVYGAVLDELYDPPGKKPRLVLLHERSEVVAMMQPPDCPIVPTRTSDIDTLTIQDFLRVSTSRRQIRHNFTHRRLPLRLLTVHSSASLAMIGASLPETDISKHDDPWWLGFMHAYPEAWGYAQLTQVGFNPARTEALLQVMHRCGTRCGSNEMMLLRVVDGAWRVVERMPQAEGRSDPGYRSLRFRGVDAEPPWLEATAVARADSIRKERLPRAIRGTLTDSASGARLAFFRISVYRYDGIPRPRIPLDYAYSDSQGRYVVRNPPLGRIAITVHCPKSTARPGASVEWAHVMVTPGSDNILDFTMIKMPRCQKSP